MDQFIKLRKKMTMTESTRQMLNKSIDLLHKLSKKKITTDAVKSELSTYLSNHILTINQIDGDKKLQLEQFINLAGEIVDSVDGGKIPLYEGIMALNKMVMPEQQTQEEEPRREKPAQPPSFIRLAPLAEKDPGMVSREFDPTGAKLEELTMSSIKPREEASRREVGELFDEVFKNKAMFEQSIVSLNASLKTIGFELKPVR